MSVVPRPHPPAFPHGELREVLPGIHMVSGTIGLPGPLPIKFSRNMVAITSGDRVVLVNTLRLNDEGLAALDKIGKVTDVIRIAGNHGSDDPFYAEKYGARVWVVKGQRYTAGFDSRAPDVYFTPQEEMDANTKLPLDGAKLYVIGSRPSEGVLHLDRDGGICITGDALQHWHTTDAYFNWFARLMMRAMGFIKAHNVGPAWLKSCKPPKDDLRGLLDLSFENVLPAHGAAVLGGAREKFRAAIERATA